MAGSKLSIRAFVDRCIASFVRKYGPKALPCWRCDDHRRVAVYDVSDEYAAPCPVCIGPEAYLKKIQLRTGSYTRADVDYAYAGRARRASLAQGGRGDG